MYFIKPVEGKWLSFLERESKQCHGTLVDIYGRVGLERVGVEE